MTIIFKKVNFQVYQLPLQMYAETDLGEYVYFRKDEECIELEISKSFQEWKKSNYTFKVIKNHDLGYYIDGNIFEIIEIIKNELKDINIQWPSKNIENKYDMKGKKIIEMIVSD